jgi:PAS domain S-box-containing protein
VKGKSSYEDFRSRRIVSELFRRRRHLVAILRALAPGALEVERDGAIAWVNAGATQVLEMTEAELVGEAFVALVPPPDQARVRRLLSDLVESEESTQVVTALNFDGRFVSVRLVPIVEDEICSAVLVILEGEVGESVRKLMRQRVKTSPWCSQLYQACAHSGQIKVTVGSEGLTKRWRSRRRRLAGSVLPRAKRM